MKLIDKVQKIREEVERLKSWNNNVRNSTRHMTLQEEDFNRGKHSSYLEILNFIDSLQEEHVSEKKCIFTKDNYTDEDRKVLCDGCKEDCEYAHKEEPVSEDLEEAVHEYMQHIPESEPELMDSFYTWEQMEAAFKAGAKWQFNQFEKNRLAACDRATDEEIKREKNFVDKIIIGEHRQPTYSDAIEYGIKWQKEKMMQDAVERVVKADAGGYPYIDCNIELYDYDKDIPLAKDGDKVKIIVIK